PGDGSNALRMAQFFQEPRLLNGRATPGEFLGAMVAGLGVKSQMATSMLAHQDVLIGHLERLRASVSGVSIDEEMTNLIQYQHAYAAAARLITTVDEAIEMIINRMGLVGR
ncbi:MAG TPA: flagellar basal body rod C-terminal domain-containing protein, partial [Limnochordia bacterium]|nr:flagellar basal body rod C-terminal domain-containing protein [Limnochordia bacterium]